jgi:5-methyltetrahydrofolate--homocysteine methyltransferase
LLACPQVIGQIHESYLEAGADAVETDTFGGNPLVLADFDLADRVREINVTAAQVARKACEKYATPEQPRFVVGSMGPGTKLLTLGNTDWDTLRASYHEQVVGLIEGGVDALLFETAQDLLQVKCAINAAIDALAEMGKTPDDIPIMVQVTIETTGTMLLGSEIAAAAHAIMGYPILSLGLNCATGPVEMTEHVQWLSRYWPHAISIVPNAGLPALVDGRTEFPLGPEPFTKAVSRFVDQFGVNIVGGCCGTTPEHIRQLVDAVKQIVPKTREIDTPGASCTSLYSPTEYRQDTSILNIGERNNASGSRAFKRLLEAEDWDGMISLARAQVREGSHVLDINVDYAGRDNAADMAELVHRLVRQVDVPLMLDSTQVATLEAGLKQAGGKCLINSANLEDGEEKFAIMCNLAKRYGAGLVLGCIDEDPEEAMARTAERKIAIATRMHKLATETHGLAEHDLLFDPLVLPISTGMDKDRRSALETIEGTRQIAQQLPHCQITCGLSNVSFGLKPVVRQVLNSVFLFELIQAGMSSAILHSSKILPRNKIADDQWQASLDLIYDKRTEDHDPLQAFIALFPDDVAVQTVEQSMAELSLEEQLPKHIIDGEKQDLIECLEESLKTYSPLEVINDHLLGGMKVVGELFGSGQMQLPFVLQSAEVMKMAVGHLEQYMDKSGGPSKGKIVLATVRGDVHDIGKNLVDMILSNNGDTVFNLGIKQPIGNIIARYREEKANAIGLSGLLVKSVQVMRENIDELNDQQIQAPMLLGGAALSRSYCEGDLRSVYEGHCYYGKDAFEGLRIMDLLMAQGEDELNSEIEARLTKKPKVAPKVTLQDGGAAVAVAQRSAVATDVLVPTTPFLGCRVVEDIDLDQIYTYINEVALFKGQWQMRKGSKTADQYKALVEDEVLPVFNRLKAQCRDENILQPKVVYGYYPCASEGDTLNVYDPDDTDRIVERFTFPRQSGGKRFCISDFFHDVDSSQRDVIGMTCVTMGQEVSRRAMKLFEANEYSEYLYLHGLGVETAEALAEMWHKRMRQEMGIDGDDGSKVRDLFAQRYRGSRYSFGYPACPEMADQQKLFRLLEPSRIGCTLTENWQIDPEQSTSAILVHHPEAKYFNV